MAGRFTYLVLLFGWALPVIALHWAVGGAELRRRARLLAVAVALPTVYLTLADGVAISSGVWEISDRYSAGLRWRGIVLEEALFFLLTNLIVAQSIVLFLAPSVRERARRFVRTRRPRGGVAIAALVAGVVLAADALASWAVATTLALGERRELIPGVLVLTHVRNTGAAYGLFAGQCWLLVALSALVLLVAPLMLRVLARTVPWPWAGPVLAGMLVGGASGNLVERAATGYVTDFLRIPIAPFFQVFNLSDAAISVAVAAFIGLSLIGHERRPTGSPEPHG